MKAAGRMDTVSLDQWVALNDELAALVRAGLPLETGLRRLGGDGRDRVARLGAALADRLNRGEDLASAMSVEGVNLPPSYAAVVSAGLRSGRLAEGLEGLAEASRNQSEMRRQLGLALIYPFLLAVLGYGLLVFFVMMILPKFGAMWADFRVPITEPSRSLDALGRVIAVGWPVGAVALILAFLLWWFLGRTVGHMGWLRRVPVVGGAVRDADAAVFAEVAAVLVEHDVPLGEAAGLAARSTADPHLIAAADTMAGAVASGENGPDMVGDGFPPLLRWMMTTGLRQGRLVPSLRHAADSYRTRATHRAELLRTFLPIVLTIGVGAVAVLVYGLLLFVPFSALLRQLAEPYLP
jgi:general secretion pathway protein F